MPISISETVAPTEEPVSLAEAKTHCRVDVPDEDSFMSALITAARRWCEAFQGRAYVDRTYELKLDGFASPISLPYPPLSSVTSIAYVDENGDTQTLDTDYYDVDTHSEPGRVLRAYDVTYPSTRTHEHVLTITYVAGYGGADDVPQEIKQAILLLVGHWFINREAVLTGTVSKDIEFAVKALLWPARIIGGI